MDIKILVAHHKFGFVYKDDVFLPIHVGKEISNTDLNIQGDNAGDNISALNPYYCEVTAIYWAWKNLNADFVGLCHYRRYPIARMRPALFLARKVKFEIKKIISILNKNAYFENSNFIEYSNYSDLENDLALTSIKIKENTEKGVKLFVPRPYCMTNTVYEHFKIVGEVFVKKLIEIVNDLYSYHSGNSNNFIHCFNESLTKNYLYPANVFVMDMHHFSEYCSIMFGVLDEHYTFFNEKDPDFRKNYSRISGYMAELITNAYIQMLIKDKVNYLYMEHGFIKA